MQQQGSSQLGGETSQEPIEDSLLLRRCRERLVAHIEKRTGIEVEPGKVCLMTRQSDTYTWTFTAEVAYLFEKDLADHTAEAYQKLCREVGKSFHAMRFTTRKGTTTDGLSCMGSPPPYAALDFEADECGRDGASDRISLSSHRLTMMEMNAAHAAVARLQLEQDISTLEKDNERLAQEARRQREDADYHRDFFYRLLEATTQLSSSVEDIHQDYTRAVDISIFPRDEFSFF